jgi:hypothetical protein
MRAYLVAVGVFMLAACGGATSVAPTATASASATSEAFSACVTARIQSRNACNPEVEDPDLQAHARSDCETAEREGRLALVTACSSKSADDTHEACQRMLAECLAGPGPK